MSAKGKNRISPGRISEHSEGIGAPTPEMVDARAAEIAETEGRLPDDVTKKDIERARRELAGQPRVADEEMESKAIGSRNPGDPTAFTGKKAPEAHPTDEQSLSQQQVMEGVEEAAHEQMLEGNRKSRRS